MWGNCFSSRELGAIPVGGNGGGRPSSHWEPSIPIGGSGGGRFLPPRGPGMDRMQRSTTPTTNRSLRLKKPSILTPTAPPPLKNKIPSLKCKMLLPPATPKLPETLAPRPPETNITATTILQNTHLLPSAEDLQPEQMRKLRSEHEGSIFFTRVSASEIWSWAKENFKAIDNDQFD